MMKWVNKCTCLGFIFVPHKTCPFVNEWHAISCSESGILFCVGLVEGKDLSSKQPNQQIFSERGKCIFNVVPHQKNSYNREYCCVRFWFICSVGIGGYK